MAAVEDEATGLLLRSEVIEVDCDAKDGHEKLLCPVLLHWKQTNALRQAIAL